MIMVGRRRQSGFTVIEVLVTVLVIGILASVVTITYNAVQARTRDDERATKVAIIKDALEQYYRRNGDYPSNDALNPTKQYPVMTDFSTTLNILRPLNRDALQGAGSTFWPACVNSSWCPNSGDDWAHRLKQFIYLSRFDSQGSGTAAWFNVPVYYADNTGWGCRVKTFYNDPGFTLVWYKESEKKWVFERSQHGQIEIDVFPAGSTPPQPCEWDKT